MTGRKRFDEEAALDAVMEVFWTKGFGAASLASLEHSTGLNKSSLYNAYESKDRLFEISLERFANRFGGVLAATLEAPRFADAIEGFFNTIIDIYDDEATPNSCLFTMASVEANAISTTAIEFVRENEDGLKVIFAERAAQAVKDDDLPPGTNCDAIAAMLIAQTRGIAVLNRSSGGTKMVKEAVAGMLALLPRA